MKRSIMPALITNIKPMAINVIAIIYLVFVYSPKKLSKINTPKTPVIKPIIGNTIIAVFILGITF